ncbi:MAG: ABC transporter ATP-binding protein [Bacilli bacterium]|nr:ABC transporter ATP-binding protein [Bacilli bacterium]
MKSLKNFKILFRYFKNDKFILSLYIILTIIKHFEPLLNAFIWANGFQALADGNKELFITYLLLWSGVIIIAWVFIQLPTDLIYNKLEKKFMEYVIKDLYAKVTDLPAIAFEDIGTGEFINRMANDPDRILQLLQKLIKLTCRLVIAIVIVCVSFTISVYVGLELVILCIVMFLLSNVYYPKLKKIQEDIKKDSDKYIKVATQNISGIREIKALGIKENIERRIYVNIESLFKKQLKIGVNETVYYALNNLCYFVIQFFILLTLGMQVFNGSILLASFLLIEKYIWRIDEVVESLSEFGVCFNKVTVSLNRIDEILNNRLYEDEKFGLVEVNDDRCEIEFKDVKFKYREEDSDLILKGLTMKLEPNKKIAVVGKSGQGKSTLFNLLLRYFDNDIGTITINGVPLKELSEKSLRDNISVIRQSPYLFNSSIFDNFKVVKEDVTLDEVREVCKKAYIDEYIMSLPDGYETIIGEGGVNLSGGQKQRIAIARTLLKDTKVILFDEATSALDNESQEYIKKTIDDLVSTHTIIIVAHRLSTIMDADQIFVIDEGKVSASGTHDELMESSELYKKLYSPEVLDF